MGFLGYDSSPKTNDGIFVSKARVIGVTDLSGKDNNGRTRDLSLQCKLSVDGVDFEPMFYVSGDFKRDPVTNHPVSIHSAFKVVKFVSTVTGITRVEVDKATQRIPGEIINDLVGKEFWRLTYRCGTKPDGKAKYKTWNTVAHIDSDPEELRKEFLAEHTTKGYPKDYDPGTPF